LGSGFLPQRRDDVAVAALGYGCAGPNSTVPPTLDGETLTRLAQAARELFDTIASSEINGRALIECCPTELKQQVNVWGPARDDLTLIERLKQAFDPQGILSPGRFLGGI